MDAKRIDTSSSLSPIGLVNHISSTPIL